MLCGPAELVGLELADLEDGLIAPSVLKKLEPRLRTAGEEGIFCRVSTVRSDSEGRGLREVPEGFPVSSPVVVISSSVLVLFISRIDDCEVFLSVPSLLDFRWTSDTTGEKMTVSEETSRLWPVKLLEWRALEGVEGDWILEDKLSREALFRSRGLTMASLDGCKLSREDEARTPEVFGTGSLEGRGIPDGLLPLVD